jgi:hypothetical protein
MKLSSPPLCCLVVLAALCATAQARAATPANAAPPRVLCYVETLFGGARAETLDLSVCTDVIDAFALPDEKGGLTAANGIPRLPLLRSARTTGARTVLALGGATVPGKSFTALAGDPGAREKLFAAIGRLVLQGGYDGVDLDWEFPRPTERDSYLAFVTALRTSLDALFRTAHPGKHALLFLGISPASAIEGYAYPQLAAQADLFVHFGYDFRNPALGPWASDAGFWPDGSLDKIEGSVRGAASELIRRGLPREKLVIGLPLYTSDGRSWTDVRERVLSSGAALDPIFLETLVDGYWVTGPEGMEAKVRKILGGAEIAGGAAAGIALWQLGHQGLHTDLTEAVWRALPPRAPSHPIPADSARLARPPESLIWADSLGSVGYQVYCGDSRAAVEEATPQSAAWLGKVRNPRVQAPHPLKASVTYWRVDSIGSGGSTRGPIWCFSVGAKP